MTANFDHAAAQIRAIKSIPGLEEKLQTAFTKVERFIAAYQKLTLEQELELWKAVDEGRR